MEQLLALTFDISNTLAKCKLSMRIHDFPRITYATNDIDKQITKMSKHMKNIYKKINMPQYEHILYVFHNLLSEINTVIIYLENQKMYKEFEILEIASLRLKSIT